MDNESIDQYLKEKAGKAVGIVVDYNADVSQLVSSEHGSHLKDRRDLIRLAFRHGY